MKFCSRRRRMHRYCKRLIEVDLPIKRISAHARREKSIRHGHISTLHIWWARRPLATCRAVICAALWPEWPAQTRYLGRVRDLQRQEDAIDARTQLPKEDSNYLPYRRRPNVQEAESGRRFGPTE